MAAKRNQFSWDHPVIVTFMLIAVVASMSLAAEVLKPLALAVLLSFALSPAVRFLERHRLPRPLAVILTVVLALGTLSGIGYIIFRELDQLASEVSSSKDNILSKIDRLNGQLNLGGPSKFKEIEQVGDKLGKTLAEQEGDSLVRKVQVVTQPTLRQRVGSSVGPYLEFLGIGAFDLILVMFLLMKREDVSDRIIQLFGRRRITLTTRTMDEVGQRISRYLGMFVTVNSTFGLIVGLGLWVLHVPYAALWGVLAAALRFIPYIGPATAIALPLLYSVATTEGWRQPLEVVAMFGVLEVVANSFLEPVIYGKTTGVSALGLLVAAMFWTWLWGPLGLMLSTPMTVCLAVVGKYVPSLGFFAILLGEEAELPRDVRFYQRLLALDQDGAAEIIEEALKAQPRAEVYDGVLVPSLSRAERDFARDELDEREQAFVWRVTTDIVEELEGVPDITLTAPALAPAADGAPPKLSKLVGIATNDTSDAVVLRMLAQLLAPAGCAMEIITDTHSPLKVAEVVAGQAPELIILSHLPPIGLTPARYLVRRLRARFKDLPIVVGRWGEHGDTAGAADRLADVGASQVAFSLVEARDRILAILRPKPAETKDKPLSPALV